MQRVINTRSPPRLTLRVGLYWDHRMNSCGWVGEGEGVMVVIGTFPFLHIPIHLPLTLVSRIKYKIWSSDSSFAEDLGLLACDPVSLCEWEPSAFAFIFAVEEETTGCDAEQCVLYMTRQWRNRISLSSLQNSDFLFYPEDWGSWLFRNSGVSKLRST